MGRNPNSLKNLEKGNSTRFKRGDTAAKVAGAKGNAAQKQKRSAQAVFLQILSSFPQLDKKTLNALAGMGITSTDDVDVQTLIGAAIAQKSMKGDVKAAQLAFDMAGELMATKLAQEKVRLERERLELEKQRLELERQSLAQNEVVVSGVDPFIQALTAYGNALTAGDTDVPDGAPTVENKAVRDGSAEDTE